MTTSKPLRLWPGVTAALILLFLLALPVVSPDAILVGMFGGVACGVAIVLWWLFFSRAAWSDRLGAIVLMIAAVFVTKRLVHPSIANAGMNMMMPIFAIPVLSLGLVAGAAASRRFTSGARRATMVAAIALAASVFTMVRTGGISGNGISDLHWRWTRTPEERLLAQAADEPTPIASAPKAAETSDKPLPRQASDEPAPTVPTSTPAHAETLESRAPAAASGEPKTREADSGGSTVDAEWPGFRGPERDGIVHGVQINTDWSASPPVQMWRRAIGPGWSSFAVRGDVLYTQEQRGEDEIVAAYKLTTGEPLWRHRDPVRFYESNGGAGPRATPTVSGNRVYAHGATGILNALDARSGAVVWSRNVASDTHKPVPGWGFASSPLVLDDLVIVAATGTLVAYDVATGKPRWFGPGHRGGYTSPHRATIDGVEQIVLLTADGPISVAPADGTLLWEHAWPGVPIVQPALSADRDILIAAGDAMGGNGIRRIAVAHGEGGWTVEERWTSRGLKPYFNDFVIHKGHVFGFDGNILACIDLEDGTRKWKGGRYGNGQLVLLPDQDLLLVLSEEGELALVGATSDQFKELARFPVLEGKTWNHPVLVHDVLLVRNDHEMVAFRLSLANH
jgi:outer membrane protein assembly factor BamB